MERDAETHEDDVIESGTMPDSSPDYWARSIAIWGAVTGTSALLWDFYKSRARLTVSLLYNMRIIGQPIVRPDSVIIVQVTNTGSKPTTITNLTLVQYGSLFGQWRKKYSGRNFVVVNYGPFPPLPHVLQVGEMWNGLIQQNLEIAELALTKRLFVQVSQAAKKKPTSIRVNLPLEAQDQPRVI